MERARIAELVAATVEANAAGIADIGVPVWSVLRGEVAALERLSLQQTPTWDSLDSQELPASDLTVDSEEAGSVLSTACPLIADRPVARYRAHAVVLGTLGLSCAFRVPFVDWAAVEDFVARTCARPSVAVGKSLSLEETFVPSRQWCTSV
jgi:hypothetical protein